MTERRVYKRKKLKSKKVFYSKLLLKLIFYAIILIFIVKTAIPAVIDRFIPSNTVKIETVDSYAMQNDLSEDIEKIHALEKENPRYEFIANNISQLPASMIKLIAKTPEAAGFIEGYLKDKPQLCPSSKDLGVNNPVIYLSQWDRDWAYEPYCGEFIGTRGCAPTAIATMLRGQGINTDPKKIAKFAIDNGHITDNMTAWSIMNDIARKYKLNLNTIGNFDQIRYALDSDAIIIASMGPGDFTTSGHMIVIVGLDENGLLIINDPNSPTNSNTRWNYDDIRYQIKNLWSFTKEV